MRDYLRVIEVANARDQIALDAFYSFLVEVQTKLATYMRRMRNNNLAPVVQKVDSAIHWINHYPVDNAISFRTTYPLDSDLSGG